MNRQPFKVNFRKITSQDEGTMTSTTISYSIVKHFYSTISDTDITEFKRDDMQKSLNDFVRTAKFIDKEDIEDSIIWAIRHNVMASCYNDK